MFGSGLFSKKKASKPHLVAGSGGLPGEIADLRADVAAVITPLAAFTVEEWTNPAAKDDNAILLVKDTLSATAVTYSGAGLDGVVGGGVMSPPRNIIITTAGTDADFGTANIVVTGKDVNGATISETLQVTAGTNPGVVTGAKAFAKVTSIAVPAMGTHTDGTLMVGFGDLIGFGKKLMARAGLSTLLMEIEAGAKVTTGTIVGAATGAPNGTYLAANTPDGTRDYAVFYEYDAAFHETP